MSGMKYKTIIGFGHQKGVGKDEAANVLTKQYGYRRHRFADCLKEITAQVFGWDRCQLEEQAFKELIDPFWEITPRKALQLVGTEAFRNNVRPDIWVKALERKIRTHYGNEKVVITDVRFPNEARAIMSWGGKIIRINRPGVSNDDPNGHASETALLGYQRWSGTITNDGTIPELATKVVAELHRLGITIDKV